MCMWTFIIPSPYPDLHLKISRLNSGTDKTLHTLHTELSWYGLRVKHGGTYGTFITNRYEKHMYLGRWESGGRGRKGQRERKKNKEKNTWYWNIKKKTPSLNLAVPHTVVQCCVFFFFFLLVCLFVFWLIVMCWSLLCTLLNLSPPAVSVCA